MLRRLTRRRPIGRVAADAIKELSLLALFALCLATIVISATSLGVRAGLLHTNPLRAFAGPPKPTQGLDGSARAESGLAPPVADPFRALVSPGAQPPSEDIGGIPVPTPSDLSRRPHGGTWLPILMYHYVRNVSRADRVGWNLSVSPDDFRKQVAWIKDHGYTPITMRDVDLILAGRKAIPLRPVALTFDDGYRDFYTAAAPILREADFTATTYVPTRLIGEKNYMSWSQVGDLDAEGFEIAAHSQYHVDISTATARRARAEVFGSKADLERHLGHQVVDWAYPFGAVDAAGAALVREAGFWSGTTTQSGSWHDPSQLLYLSRVRMGGTAELQSMINGITQPISASNVPIA